MRALETGQSIEVGEGDFSCVERILLSVVCRSSPLTRQCKDRGGGFGSRLFSSFVRHSPPDPLCGRWRIGQSPHRLPPPVNRFFTFRAADPFFPA
jgi:hypothetical protein